MQVQVQEVGRKLRLAKGVQVAVLVLALELALVQELEEATTPTVPLLQVRKLMELSSSAWSSHVRCSQPSTCSILGHTCRFCIRGGIATAAYILELLGAICSTRL